MNFSPKTKAGRKALGLLGGAFLLFRAAGLPAEEVRGLLTAVTESSFRAEVLSASKPVLVDFSAVWCAPCRAYEPVLRRIAETFSNELKVVTVDVDANSKIPGNYKVREIPTLLLFKGGKVVRTWEGGVSEAEIKRALKKSAARRPGGSEANPSS